MGMEIFYHQTEVVKAIPEIYLLVNSGFYRMNGEQGEGNCLG